MNEQKKVESVFVVVPTIRDLEFLNDYSMIPGYLTILELLMRFSTILNDACERKLKLIIHSLICKKR